MGRVEAALGIGFLALGLSSCGGGSETAAPLPKDGTIKRYGTLDPADFAHPKIARPGALKIDGCCTIETSDAKVTVLQSDAQLRIIEGSDYRAEISFGFWEPDSGTGERVRDERTIDGIALRHIAAKTGLANRQIWQAEIPVTAQASARGLVRPQLRIAAECRTAASCRQLDNMVASLRF